MATLVTPAAAATQSSLAQQAQALASQILSQSNQLHSIAITEANAKSALAQADAAVLASQTQLSTDQSRLRATKAQLSSAAVEEYVGGLSINALTTFLSSSEQSNLVRSSYQSVATSNVSDLIQSVEVDQAKIKSAQKSLQINALQARQSLATVTSSAASLQSEITQEQSTLSSVNAQEQSLIQAALAAAARQKQVQGLPIFHSAPAVRAVVQSAPAVKAILTVASGVSTAPPVTNSLSADFAELRNCESGDNYAINTGNGYYGAYQFSLQTWEALGYSGLPSSNPPATQDQAAQTLQAQHGWGQWPACSAMLGL